MIGIVGKYVHLKLTSYKSLHEALVHGGLASDCRVELEYIDSEQVEQQGPESLLSNLDAVLVPGGFGDRGTEGKIAAIGYARTNKIPFFGICLGMQLAVVEYARTVAGLAGANSSEFDKDTPAPVIDLMPEQRSVRAKGATMRLGAYPCVLTSGSIAADAYGTTEISERHRHRYEFSNDFREKLMEAGLVLSGTSPDKRLARGRGAEGPSVLHRLPVSPGVQEPACVAPSALRALRAGRHSSASHSPRKSRDAQAGREPASHQLRSEDAFFDRSRQSSGVRCVTRTMRAKAADGRPAFEVEVPDQVEELVTGRFVRSECSPGAVDCVGRDEDDAGRIHVSGEAASEKLVDLLGQREGARGRDPGDKIVGIALPARHRRDPRVPELEADFDVDGAVRWSELVPARADLEHAVAHDAQCRASPRGRKGLDGLAPADGPPVEERHLRALDGEFDPFVDPQPGERRHRVLDRPEPVTPASLNRSRSSRRYDLELVEACLPGRPHQAHRPVRPSKGHAHSSARMKAHALERDCVRQSDVQSTRS